MNAYMTSGTLDFLVKIANKHPNLHLFFMQAEDQTVVYYEDMKPTIFETARKFEVVVSNGDLREDGFVVMNNIPVTDEGKPIFESQFKQRAGMIENTPGFYALRVLRPVQGNKYVVMVQWRDQASYEKWKNSDSFAKSHAKSGKKEKAPYAAGPSYVTNYHMVDFDKEN
ncbi:antibiotic biosynthesis monooxygenase [Aquibacillus koreensis]|uniref:Antibiotic biosynthesis monooxygenase n=1 Tax=Aquibacillus koreensis TaxID=279446 RepID=A0A9X3WJN7_9BACI|nr:antibiotic biosynthesis monooxygenase [Aquibacillus koreensis]MCT2535582.1 antibiotic biosynthesis monooxygenase [Aquibacillus koreensis]MDC3420133.1 antibiotic biosynthesis monooxygenase [Aquibacillus koreensis]